MNTALHNIRLGQVEANPGVKDQRAKAEQSAQVSFREILGNRMDAPACPVQFSKHAALRLSDRNISLTGEQIDRVAEGIGKAGEKGIRDSLVLVDDVALVINVKSRTVITAIGQATDNVFSNIDGAVIV
jgi:flagellar operon protein